MEKYKNRREVPEKYKWDLSDFFESEDEFNSKLEECKKMIDDLKKYIGCTKNADKLYEFLNLEMAAVALWEDLYVYSHLINDQELGIAENLERKNKTEILSTLLETNISFFAPELLSLSKDDYNKLFDENRKLLEYKVSLDDIYREKDHVLTESEEKIVTELTNSMNHFDSISSNLLNNEHNYKKIKLDDGTEEEIAVTNYRKLLRNKNKNIRKKVYNSFNKVLNQYGTTSASLLNSYVNMNNSIAKIRRFDSSWDRKLFNLNLSNKVFTSLVNAVENNLDNLHKYYDLMKRVLGEKVLNHYDIYMDISESDKEYSIEEAQNIIRESLKPLGSEYLEKFEKIITNRYIDYCQYKGKQSGGYSFCTLTKDSRILMSYNGVMDSISTIAHEAGHNVHHQFVNENNPLQYRQPSNIVCEVASLTNECLLSNYILNNSKDNSERKIGLENLMEVIVSNLFSAVREGKIEQEIYDTVLNGGMITKELLDNKAFNYLKKYFGKSVKLDKYSSNNWITRSHYYMNFYLYSYSICISVAITVADKILAGDKDMLSNYIKFLTLGSDTWPIDAMKVLGIDLEDETVYINAAKYLGKLVDEYNKILDLEEK